MWDYASERWIPANKINDVSKLEELGISNVLVEPGNTSTGELRRVSGEWNGTTVKLFSMTMAFFLPGIDYSALGCIQPRKTKQIWLGIGIFFLFTFLLGTAICAPLAFIIWIHGVATVAKRSRERVAELGGFTNDIWGRKI